MPPVNTPATAFLLFLILAVPAVGDLVVDDFDREDGILVGSLLETGAAWETFQAGSEVQINSGAVLIDGGASEEVGVSFLKSSGKEVFYAYDLMVSRPPNKPWIFTSAFKGGYGGFTGSVGRIFVSSSPASGHFSIGVENDKDNPVWWPEDLLQGSTYRVVVGFFEMEIKMSRGCGSTHKRAPQAR